MKPLLNLEPHQLNDQCKFWTGVLPQNLALDGGQFEALWAIHPLEFHEIRILGRAVKTPRWQQAYGMDYHYTGQTNKALPLPPLLMPFLTWVQNDIDDRLNGFLLNWYDGSLGHYIGRHSDSTTNMIHGAPIATISFGEERIFRIRPRKNTLSKAAMFDFPAKHGTVFVMPFETNLAFTHEIPKSAACKGRRISLTVRSFTR